jgi:hypothetical protein
MRVGNRFFVLASVPWGDGARQIQPRLQDYPSFAIASEAQKQQIHAPVRLRLGAARSLHVLNEDYRDLGSESSACVTHLSAAGAWEGKTPVPPPPAGAESRRIEDFAVDPDHNSFFLESLTLDGERCQRLVKLNKGGELVWESRESLDEQAGRGRLFIDDQARLYRVSRPHRVVQIDAGDGRAFGSIDLRAHAEEKLFVGPAGVIFRTMFLETHNCYAMAAYDAASGREQVVAGDATLYGVLPYCFGVDGQRRFYAYQSPRQERAGALVRAPFTDEGVDIHLLEGLVVQSDHPVVFTYFMEGASAVITRYEAGGARGELILSVPDEFEEKAAENCRLIRVDEAGRFHLLVGERPQSTGILLILGEGGELLEAVSPAPKLRALMSAAQPFRSWQVDAEGNVYIPVLQPDSLNVVCLTS